MSWDDFVQSLCYDEESMGEEAWLQYIEQLEWLHSHPLAINTATPEDMALLPFLTPAQIEAIQAYVHLDGPMKSLGELALIPAIDYHTRQVLPLFFTVGHTKRSDGKKGGWFRNMHNTVDSRMDIPLYYRKGYQTGKYAGSPLYNRIRHSLESDHVNIGAHVKKDPGERFYDSFGGYAMIHNKGIVRTAIIGDYRAGWGEGLVISRGTSTSKSNLMSNTSQGIRPMTGMAESGFLRGVAITLGRQADWNQRPKFSMSGTLFASYRALDATLDAEGNAKTIVENGYHRTETEIAKKNNLPQVVIDFITSHHGRSQTAYFYMQYCNNGGDPANKEDFTYQGTLPTAKEQVVMMMADAVEAASRTLKDYSAESISKLVDGITSQRISDSQLAMADISIKEINVVKAVFKKHLQEIYHARIAYPPKKTDVKRNVLMSNETE
jgi:hypothetical protein